MAMSLQRNSVSSENQKDKITAKIGKEKENVVCSVDPVVEVGTPREGCRSFSEKRSERIRLSEWVLGWEQNRDMIKEVRVSAEFHLAEITPTFGCWGIEVSGEEF